MKHKEHSALDMKTNEYDKRCGVYVSRGDNHGVGKSQPVGHSGDPKQFAPCLPQKSKGKHEGH